MRILFSIFVILMASAPAGATQVTDVQRIESCVSENVVEQVIQGREPDFLDMNENPLGPSTKALEWTTQNAPQAMHRYPRETIQELKESIAAKNGVDASHVVIDSGSDEIVYSALKNLVGRNFIGLKKHVLTPQFDYFAYKDFCDELKVPLRKAAVEPNFKVDVDALLKQVGRNTGVVLLSNPANPTGAFLNNAEMSRLAGALNRRGVKLIIDSAYREYATDSNIADPHLIASKFNNVVMLGTFSKAYGLAGMRLGYAIGPPELVNKINSGIHPSTITTVSAHAALEALKDDDFLGRVKSLNEAGKARLMSELPKYGMHPYPSQTSFVLVQTPIAGSKLAGLLNAEGIKVRDMTKLYGLTHYVRISIGRVDQIDRLLKVLDDLQKKGLLNPDQAQGYTSSVTPARSEIPETFQGVTKLRLMLRRILNLP
jgi:histidinol-phosphate aminotransferase